MRDLLRLEWLWNRRAILANLALCSVFFGWTARELTSPRAFVAMLGLFMGFAGPLPILGREDKFKTAAFVHSLPVRRDAVILARYALVWIFVAAGVALAVVLAAVLPFSRVPLAEVLTVRNLLLVTALVSLFFALELPLVVRFGLKGVMFLLVGLQVLGLALMAGARLFGRIPFAGAMAGGEDLLRGLLRMPGSPAVLAALAAAIILFNAASVGVSMALAESRDL